MLIEPIMDCNRQSVVLVDRERWRKLAATQCRGCWIQEYLPAPYLNITKAVSQSTESRYNFVR